MLSFAIAYQLMLSSAPVISCYLISISYCLMPFLAICNFNMPYAARVIVSFFITYNFDYLMLSHAFLSFLVLSHALLCSFLLSSFISCYVMLSCANFLNFVVSPVIICYLPCFHMLSLVILQ